ncbi:hypothetical protein E4T47_02316 [Aureobasidium subglaciale]|nr:hypothetical protein E4T47_02316 [Aureobasidium subglaciale]
MAISSVDRKILSDLITKQSTYGEVLSDDKPASNNEFLKRSLYTVLGISMRLESKLELAYERRTHDISTEIRTLSLYHEIIFLAKEGLALTEVSIAPFCGPEAEGEYQTMGYKLRASFHHIFCLYHNTPPVRQLRRKKMEGPSAFSAHWLSSRLEAPEMAVSPAPSVQSFITNPYSISAQAPAVMPHVLGYVPPKITVHPRMIPERPPGLGAATLFEYDPPVSAGTYLMPALDYTPETKRLFECATRRAESYLHPRHPLLLSLALEHASFLMDCLGDHDGCLKVIIQAARGAARSRVAPNTDWKDSTKILHDMTDIIRRAEDVLQPERRLVPPIKLQNSPPLYPPPDRELPAPPRQYDGSPRQERSVHHYNGTARDEKSLPEYVGSSDEEGSLPKCRGSSGNGPTRMSDFPMPPIQTALSPSGGVKLNNLHEQVKDLGILKSPTTDDSPASEGPKIGTLTRSGPVIEPPHSPMNLDSRIQQINDEIVAYKRAKRSVNNGLSTKVKSGGRRLEGNGTEKERKRRALERAEDELIRKRNTLSETSTTLF